MCVCVRVRVWGMSSDRETYRAYHYSVRACVLTVACESH